MLLRRARPLAASSRFALRVALHVAVAALAGAPFALHARSAEAQINAETLRRSLDHDGVSGSLEGSLTGRAGNTEGLVSGGTAQLAFVAQPHSGFVYARGDYVHLGGVTQVARSFVHVRGDEQLAPWLYWELFGQVQQDRFLRLRLRTLLGTGPRLRLFADAEWSLYVGTAYMIERESVSDDASERGQTTVANRWSSYLAVSYKASDLVTLTSTTYVQPRFDALGDLRSLEEASLVITVTKRLSTKLGCTLRYDRRPPTGVKPTDVEIRNALALSW